MAAALEARSEHPLALAILNAAQAQNIELSPVQDFTAVSGRGIVGAIAGKTYYLGNDKMMQEQEIKLSEIAATATQLATGGATPVYLADSDKLIAMLAISDPVRNDAKTSIARLHELDIQTVLLTGDNQQTALAVANELNIDQVIAEVMPDDKVAHISGLQSIGEIVAMVGDGINDAPALAQSDVGIAIGTGTDVALEAADIALMGSSLEGVSKTIALSKSTLKNIKQNLAGAFVYNIIGIPIAAGVLYPVFGILLSPVIAAAAMSMSSVTVVSNALRLGKVEI